MAHTTGTGEPWTFATDQTGDIQWTSQNRPAIVRGDRATVQDLKVALATHSQSRAHGTDGEDPRDPDFGLDVFAAVRSMTALKREIRRTLEYDDYRHNRVSAIRDLTITRVAGTKQNVQVTVVLSLADEPENVTLVFDLTTGSLDVVGGNS